MSVMINKYISKRAKTDTDRFELGWHVLNTGQDGIASYHKSVWESPTYVGPEAYNAGHIDFILESDANDVRSILRADDGVFLCRRCLAKERVKFIP